MTSQTLNYLGFSSKAMADEEKREVKMEIQKFEYHENKKAFWMK